MKERLQELGEKLLKNIDRVGVAVFAALLVGAVFLFLQESGDTVTPIESPPATAFDELIPSEEYDKVVVSLFELQPDIEERDEYRPLIVSSLFDARTVRASVEAVREIEDDYNRALVAYEAGNLTEATRLVEAILRRMPTHRRTLELQDQIVAARAAQDADQAPQ